MSSTTAQPARHGRVRGFGHFVLHFFEMCMPMCIGWAVGDLVYFAVADPLGSSEPFRDWPELSLAVVTFYMTAPMIACMRFRGMPRRPTAEMAAAMIILFAAHPRRWRRHRGRGRAPVARPRLMMPAMLVPMLLRLELYTGHAMAVHR